MLRSYMWMDGWMGLGLGLGWDLCVGLLYEHRFAVLISVKLTFLVFFLWVIPYCTKLKFFLELSPDTPKMDFLATSNVGKKATGYNTTVFVFGWLVILTQLSGRSENVSKISLRPVRICVCTNHVFVYNFLERRPLLV